MAVLRVMTGGWLGSAALASRLRQAPQDHAATCPDQQGQPLPNPTAHGVFPSVVGLPLRRLRGAGAFGRHRTDQHPHLRRRLGRPSEALYS